MSSPAPYPPPPPNPYPPKKNRTPLIILGVVLGAIVLFCGGCLAVVASVGEGDGATSGDGASSTSAPSSASGEEPDEAPSSEKPSAKSEKPEKTKEPKPTGVLVIEVRSTESTQGSVTFTDPTKDNFQLQQITDAALPWRKRWTGVDSLPLGWNMNVQQKSGGTITCKVTLDGEVVAEGKSSGPYAVVTCAA